MLEKPMLSPGKGGGSDTSDTMRKEGISDSNNKFVNKF